jgi:hypothetical protein
VREALRNPLWVEGANPPGTLPSFLRKHGRDKGKDKDGDDAESTEESTKGIFKFKVDYGGLRLTPYLRHPQFDVDFKGITFSSQPTFEEMSTEVIETHAEELKPQFAPWTAPLEEAVLEFESRQYLKLNPSRRDGRREAKVVLNVRCKKNHSLMLMSPPYPRRRHASLRVSSSNLHLCAHLAGQRWGAKAVDAGRGESHCTDRYAIQARDEQTSPCQRKVRPSQTQAHMHCQQMRPWSR